jgi:hypothetical protein
MSDASEYMWVKRREWDNLVAKVDSIGFPDGSGTQHHTPRQVALSVRQAGGAGSSPVKLTAKTNDTTYIGKVYGNGVDATATETAAVIRVREIAAGETIRFNVTFAASKQKWAGVDAWTLLEIPRLI